LGEKLGDPLFQQW